MFQFVIMLPILLGKTCGEEHRPCSWVTMEQEETWEEVWWVIKLLVAWVESRNTRLASIKKSSCACKHNDAYCTSRDTTWLTLHFCYHWMHLPQQNATLSNIGLHDYYIEVFFNFPPKKTLFLFQRNALEFCDHRTQILPKKMSYWTYNSIITL